MKHGFVICDSNRKYLERFSQEVNRKHFTPFLMEAFTNVELLKEYIKTTIVDVLIIDEGMYTDELKELCTGLVYLLHEDRNFESTEQKGIYKFQPVSRIMEKVMCDYADYSKGAISYAGRSRAKLIGTFSPICCRQTSFLLTLARCMAEKKQVMYVNIKSTYGLKKLLEKGLAENDLSDVMYDIRNDKGGYQDWKEESISHYGELSFIAPAATITDLQCVKTKEWMVLLDELSEMGGFDYIFIDMDESINSCYEILRRCELIYMPKDRDEIEKLIYEEFQETIFKLGYSDVWEKRTFVSFPDINCTDASLDYLDEIREGELGRYVRKLLTRLQHS